MSAGATLHAQACAAENAGLRGDFDAARRTLAGLLATPRLPPTMRGWLLTTLAELDWRAGDAARADASYRAALAALADGYAALSYADFLIAQGRHAEALRQLQHEPRSDAVLLRLAIAGTRAPAPAAASDAQELRERMAQAALRPDARTTHAREQAMFALWVDGAPQRALELARANVRLQREPLDVLLFAQAAHAQGDAAARREAGTIAREMGLHDRRLDPLL